MENKKFEFSKHSTSHLVVEASAGTGKTYTIEKMIPEFIINNIPIEKIAVLTFTEKAAAELQDRIRTELLEQLKNLTGESKSKFENALTSLPNANIGTIHNFCRFLLKKHSIALGFSSKFSEIRDIQEEVETYFKKFWAKIEKDDPEDLLKLLMQIEYNNFKNALIELTVKTGGKKIKPLDKPNRQLLDISLKELKVHLNNSNLEKKKTGYTEKVISYLGKSFLSPYEELIETRNAFFTKDFSPAQYLKKYITETNDLSSDKYDEILDTIRIELQSICAYYIFEPLYKYANMLIEDYDHYLQSQDSITVDGLILNARKLVSDPEIRKQIQNRIQYLILDECQDSNPIQIDLVTELFKGLDKGIILVGDPKQSIYRFRQADLNSYNNAVSNLKNRNDFPLTKSYRSSKRLVDAFNFIFPKFNHLKENYKPVSADRIEDLTTAPPLLLLGLNKDGSPRSEDKEGNPFGAETLRADAMEEIINLIKTISYNEKYKIEKKGEKNETREIKLSDIAILASSNAGLQKIMKEFSKHSIPANIYKSKTFYTHKIVQAISHLLHAVENPNDSSSLYKTLASDLFLVPESVLYRLSESGELNYLHGTEFSEINSIFESLRSAHENRYTKDAAFTLLKILQENRILEVISLGFDGKRNLANIYHLCEILSYNQLSEKLSFGEIVRQLKKDVQSSVEQEIKLDNDKNDESFNSVQLMTMHASKGLEFPVCILYDLANIPKNDSTSIFIKDPFLRGEEISIDLELASNVEGLTKVKTKQFLEVYESNLEELNHERDRLLYVAFTRARDYLVLPLHILPDKNGEKESEPDKKNKQDKAIPLRTLINEAFKTENIQELINKNLAENFQSKKNNKVKHFEDSPKIQIEENQSEIRLITITQKDIYNKSGIKIQSYSSIARHLEPEEEFVKEKVAIEKNAITENDEYSPITLSAEKRGTTFGLLCHAVMENFELKHLSDNKKIGDEVKRMVTEYYPTTGLNEVTDYTSQEAISFCISTLTKSYPMNTEKTQFAFIRDWQYIKREKSFFYKLNSPKMDYLIGIGDGMFFWNDKYYLLDWKTNLIKPSEGQTIDDVIEKKVKDSYFYQYMIYSMNLIDNITPAGKDKEEYWEKTFGGMLFIFMRITEDKKGSILVRPTYEEISKFKKGLEN